jgi:hypothetical protein
LVVPKTDQQARRKEPTMITIGVDFYPEFQQIASLDTDTGEFQKKRLLHPEEAEKFYRALATADQKVRVGMKASGHARWFRTTAGRTAVRVVDRRRGSDH